MSKPKIKWIKLDSEKHCFFEDGSEFLCALQVKNNKTNEINWEFAIVITSCDGERMELQTESGESYDDWTWFDFEYFALLNGSMPVSDIEIFK